ncbi:hypothetical protein NDU88_004438 [Pleurodeles waltl]|uniref:Uncharacterized protein n=1 Tax=Pleurodeles waltl TaxID=8319 RepID=A0AAV7NJG0_PLEWA|nr:hypothetical protein NDU88_004438 [Pleurodeles waltl]
MEGRRGELLAQWRVAAVRDRLENYTLKYCQLLHRFGKISRLTPEEIYGIVNVDHETPTGASDGIGPMRFTNQRQKGLP